MGWTLAAAGKDSDASALTRRGVRDMHLRDKIIDILLYGLTTMGLMATLTACPGEKSSEETGPASRGESGTETGPKPEV
jgi:hypothetical protein